MPTISHSLRVLFDSEKRLAAASLGRALRKEKMLKKILLVTGVGLFVAGCSPTVGSEAWCEKMKETPSGDWSTNDATAYGKNCLLKSSKED